MDTQRLTRKKEELEEQWKLLSEKIARLRHDLTIEADTAMRFQLEKQLEHTEQERETLEQQLDAVEHALQHADRRVTEQYSRETSPLPREEAYTENQMYYDQRVHEILTLAEKHSTYEKQGMSTTKKILILSANPKDTARLRLDEEVHEIDEGLKRSKNRDLFIIHQVWSVHLRDLRRAMLDYEPQIVHFCGHGEEDGLMVEDKNGNAVLVNPDALAGLFELFTDTIECVLLNACYSEPQADAISKHVNYVIGMSRGIKDEAAIEFVVGFYDALGAGKDIEEAFEFGRNAIQLYDMPDHLIPVLKKSLGDEITSLFESTEIAKKSIEDEVLEKLDGISERVSRWKFLKKWLKENQTTLIEEAIDVVWRKSYNYFGKEAYSVEKKELFKKNIYEHFRWILICLDRGTDQEVRLENMVKISPLSESIAYSKVFESVCNRIKDPKYQNDMNLPPEVADELLLFIKDLWEKYR